MWKSGTNSTGSTWRSRCPRQATFGVSAEARLTAPTASATAAARVGRRSSRRRSRSGAGTRWIPSRQVAVSRRRGKRSRQSLATSQRARAARARAIRRSLEWPPAMRPHPRGRARGGIREPGGRERARAARSGGARDGPSRLTVSAIPGDGVNSALSLSRRLPRPAPAPAPVPSEGGRLRRPAHPRRPIRGRRRTIRRGGSGALSPDGRRRGSGRLRDAAHAPARTAGSRSRRTESPSSARATQR